MIDILINKTINIFYNKKLSTFLENSLKQLYIIYFLIILFFWNVDYILFDAKYFTALIFIFCLLTYTKKLNLLKKKELYLIILFFFIHFFLISVQSNFIFYKENLLTYSYVVLSIIVVTLLYDTLRKNFFFILNSFTFIFNSFFIIFILIYLQKSGYLNIDCYRGIFSETGFIFKENSHFGLIIKAVGENHDSAHALGYNVILIRFFTILLGGALAGLGGGYLSLVRVPQWTEGMTAGAGWIALALVVFASWQPFRLLIGAYIFGGITLLQLNLQALGLEINVALLSMSPYLVTIGVLVFMSARRNKNSLEAPKSLGKTFFGL